MKRRRTKRAPDVWESAAFSSIFLASSFFCSQALSTPAHTQVPITCSVKSLGCNLGNQTLDDLSRLRGRPFFLFPTRIFLFWGTLRRPRTHLSESGNIRFCSMSDFGSPPVNENENCAEKTPFPFPGGVSPFYQNQLWRERAVLPLTG